MRLAMAPIQNCLPALDLVITGSKIQTDVERLKGCDESFSQPRFGLSLQPTRRFEVALESINFLNRAVGPFGLDRPSLAITKHQAEYGFN